MNFSSDVNSYVHDIANKRIDGAVKMNNRYYEHTYVQAQIKEIGVEAELFH